MLRKRDEIDFWNPFILRFTKPEANLYIYLYFL